MSDRRWTHLIRFSENHTGYATFRQGNASNPDHLVAVGDNVHAPGQTVAVLNPRTGKWAGKGGEPRTVLERPKLGQYATPVEPHRVLVWRKEPDGSLCIPWVFSWENGEPTVKPGPFRPTCDELARRIDQYHRSNRPGRPR